MINGFEETTEPLTDDELRIMDIIVTHIANKIGRSNAVTNQKICDGVNGSCQPQRKLTPPRLRKIIHRIRVEKRVRNLIAFHGGYYVSNDPQEIEHYKRGLKNRAASIMAAYDSYGL
jgi:hypothetical protein